MFEIWNFEYHQMPVLFETKTGHRTLLVFLLTIWTYY